MKKSIINLSAVIVTICGAALLTSGCIIHVKADASDFDGNSISLKESFTHDASDISKLYIDARAGDLEIIGVEGQDSIKVDARIRTHESKPYELSIVNNGDSAYLVAKHNSQNNNWNFGGQYIDLVVTMPAELLLDVQDSSGDMSIENVLSNIIVSDSSGDVTIKNTGGVKIIDRSGDLRIVNADGDVTIEDRSGDISVIDASGDVLIEDRSGDITVRGANSLNVSEDGSGDVYHSDIAGSVFVDN